MNRTTLTAPRARARNTHAGRRPGPGGRARPQQLCDLGPRRPTIGAMTAAGNHAAGPAAITPAPRRSSMARRPIIRPRWFMAPASASISASADRCSSRLAVWPLKEPGNGATNRWWRRTLLRHQDGCYSQPTQQGSGRMSWGSPAISGCGNFCLKVKACGVGPCASRWRSRASRFFRAWRGYRLGTHQST